MFAEEAIWIHQCLDELKLNRNDYVANVGSSNEVFRKIIQPHIYQQIFRELEVSNIKVVHIDQKPDKGVDYIANVTSSVDHEHLENMFSVILCNNLLEHVEDIQLVCNNLITWCKADGYILLTVPYKYPKHLDPIDNMLRPLPEDIAKYFSQATTKVVKQKIITIKQKENYPVKKSFYPFWGYRNRIKYYLGYRYKVSALLIKIIKN